MRPALLLLALGGLTGCTTAAVTASALASHKSHADDAVLYDTPKLQMRIVRYRDYYPLDYIGYSYDIQCAQKGKGWTTIRNTRDSLSPGAEAIARKERERAEFRVVNDDVVAWNLWGEPRISVDGCKTWNVWPRLTIDPSLIDPAPIWQEQGTLIPLEYKPPHCANPGTDCRQWEFGGKRGLHYSNADVRPDGTVSFDVASLAFKGIRALHVESHDWGVTWSYRPVD